MILPHGIDNIHFKLQTLYSFINPAFRYILMGHSLGAAVANYFTSFFPECVDALICIDLIHPYALEERVKCFTLYGNALLKGDLSAGKISIFSLEQAVDKLVAARPSLTPESAIILLPRAVKKYQNGYTWTHDIKAKASFLILYGGRNYKEVISSIQCPVLCSAHFQGLPVLL